MTKTPEPQNMLVDHIRSSAPGGPLLRRTKDVDGNSVVILAEWYWDAIMAHDDVKASADVIAATIQPYTTRERVLAELLREARYIVVGEACCKEDEDLADRIDAALATEITSSPDTPAPTLESLLAKVPEDWFWSIKRMQNGQYRVILNNWSCSTGFARYASDPVLALSAALAKMEGAG